MLFGIAAWYVSVMTTPEKFALISKIERLQINPTEFGRTQIHRSGDFFAAPMASSWSHELLSHYGILKKGISYALPSIIYET